MSKKSRARAATRAIAAASSKAPTSVNASAASCVSDSPEPNAFLARWGTLLACGIIVVAALAAYHNSFSGPLFAEDYSAIINNPSIRQWGSALSPPPGSTIGGRPLLNLTFALNYAFGGMDVWGYHAFNLFVHTLAGLTLFGIVRQTLLRPPLAARFGAVALPLALAVAAIWVVHPLQTEAVTFISQRAESLMGLFYLLTLYCFIRSVESTAPMRWQIVSIATYLFGVMSKETIVTAPVIVFLYDRTFVAGSFQETWQQRWRYYLGLAGIWLLLARLMIGAGLKQEAVGFGQGVTWWTYALTSCRSVVLYFKLAFCPHPLVFDYGTNAIVVQHVAEIVPYALVLAILLVGTAIALWRWPVAGFAGAWFFVILAPTSSVVPVVLSPTAEHRMYLSLAAIIVLVVLGLHTLIGRLSLIVFAAAAVGLGWLTVRRNEDYHSELTILSDTVTKSPDNARAHTNLGMALANLDRLADANAEFEKALRLDPNDALANNNVGVHLLGVPGRLPEAISHFRAALSTIPDYAEADNNLGIALLSTPDGLSEAIEHFQAAVRIKPEFAQAHYDLGAALERIPGHLPDAISQYEQALRIKPAFALAHFNLGMALLKIPERRREAVDHFQEALQIKPNFKEAQEMLDRLQTTTR